MPDPNVTSSVRERSQNTIEGQLAPLLRRLLILMQLGIVALLLVNMLTGAIKADARILIPNGLLVVVLLGVTLLLQRGHVKLSLWILVALTLMTETIVLLTNDLSVAGRTLFSFIIPLSIAGLFLGRAPLAATTVVSIGVVWLSAFNSPVPQGLPLTTTALQYTIISIVYAVLIDIFRTLFQRTLDTTLAQTAALERMQIDNVNLYHDAERERERLQVTLASIGDAVITTDTAAQITFMNGVAEDLTGVRTADALNKPLMDVFRIANEYTGDPVDSPVDRVLAEGVIVGLANHTVLIRPDGTQVPIADSGAPIRSAHGTTIGAVLVFRDVSEERRARLALEESESRFRTLADSAPVLVWMSDVTKACTYFNQPWLDFTGRAVAQELGDGWLDNVHPNDRDFCLKTYNDAFNERAPFTMDYRLRRYDGVYRWVADNGIPRYTQDGHFLGYIGSCIDVTERRQHEQQTRLLQEVTARFSEAVTPRQVADVVMEQVTAMLGSHIGTLYVLDADGSALEMISYTGGNPEHMDTYRTLSLEASGPLLDAARTREPIWLRNLDEYLQQYPQFADAIQANESQAIACLPLVVVDQAVGAISLSFREPQTFDPALRDFIDAIAQQCAQAMERARLFQIEADARRRAEAADLLKLQFLAMISHELRTPLTSIKGFTSTLLASDVEWDPGTQTEFLGILNDEANKLTELVEQLLDVSRLQAGNLSIEPEIQSFAHILDASDVTLRSQAQDFTLTYDIPPDLPLVLADGRRIAQVLSNLVGNAVKYSPTGTTIAVAAAVEDGMLKVTVSDEGSGIPPHEREAVFDAFHQLQYRRGGAGLGLAICRGLVEAHGGRIWIVDQETPGTTVAFTLPLSKPA